MIIDAHHHFWRYHPSEYDWMDERMDSIRSNFLPADLLVEIAPVQINGVVSVQARQSLQETEWLLDLARTHPFIKGVVGWVPLTSSRLEENLDFLTSTTQLKGARHVLQDEADEEYALSADFNRGIALLTRYGLTYDILIFERQLPYAIQLVDRHPQQVFILDHIGKPLIRENQFSPWKENIIELARRENCCCKISGMVTEAHWETWTPEQLRPYFEVILEAFGPERLMFGSDWPVCLLATTYSKWIQTVKNWITNLSESEQNRVIGETAVEVYRLEN